MYKKLPATAEGSPITRKVKTIFTVCGSGTSNNFCIPYKGIYRMVPASYGPMALSE
jgi:hypothetical protein